MSNTRITHYIPPTHLPEIPKEFVEPNPSDHFIWFLYRYRCAECKMPGQEINEIVPRARSKKSIMDWKNRILLCRSCHQKFHQGGVTNLKINVMKQLRASYLSIVGRGEYV